MNIRPLQVIHLDPESNEFIFDEKSYAEMLLSKEAEEENIRDLPVAIVSIAGDARKGKSFLLNFFLRYLQRYDQENWIGDPDEPLTGFSWREGVDSDTVGIVLWPKPFIMTRSDGSRIAVILMDTQGFFDDKTDYNKVAQFYTISTVVSSLQIYNQMRNIQSNDIETLAKFAEYAKKMSRRTGCKTFQKLLFLIRDWPNTRQFDYGFKGGDSFLKYKKSKQEDKFCKEWKDLDACFSDISCFLMPKIGDGADESDFNGEISKLKPEFVEALKKLIPSLLAPDNIVTKSWGHDDPPFWRIFNLFKELADHLTENRSIDIDKLDSINNMTFVGNAFRLAKLLFLEKIVSAGKINDNIGIIFDAAEKESLELYKDETIGILDEEDLINQKHLELVQFFSLTSEHYKRDPDWLKRAHEAIKAAIYNIKWSAISAGVSLACTIAKFFLFKRFN